MDKIIELFNEFIKNYDSESKDALWVAQSREFRDFWNGKIMTNSKEDLDDLELDGIIRILDRAGKGNTRESEAVARTMITQGAWRRMFNEIKNKPELHKQLDQIFKTVGEEKAKLIDELYKLNEGNHNNLTGPRGNAVSAMIFAYNPSSSVSVISLRDRKKATEYFGFESHVDFEKDPIGEKIVQSNDDLIAGFRKLGIKYSPRTLTSFLYSSGVKDLWKVDAEDDQAPWGGFKEPIRTDEIIEAETKKESPIKQKPNQLVREWVPPIISDLKELALNKETEWSKKMNLKPERAFEIKLGYAFGILGYEVESLGQGKGREPDGIAYSTDANSEYYYAIVYDAKAREKGYSIGTGDREISEYIKKYQKELQKRRIKKFSFLIVSSDFSDNQSLDSSIKDIYKETRCPVVLMKANDLLNIIAHKLSHAGVDHSQLEDLFLANGIINQEKIADFLE